MQQWSLRFKARTGNLADGYPAFNPSGTDDKTVLEIPHKEFYSRGKLLLRTFFGFFMAFPHAFILIFRMWWGAILGMIAWWVILFTGKYPENWHRFNVENIRWMTRLSCFFGNLIEDYPPFHGREISSEPASPAITPKTTNSNAAPAIAKTTPPVVSKPAETKSAAADVKLPIAKPQAGTATREIFTSRISDATCVSTPDNKFEVSFTVEVRKYQVDSTGAKKEIPVNDLIEIGLLKAAPGSANAEIYLKGHHFNKTLSKMTIIVNEKPDKIGIDPYNRLPEK